MPTRQSSRQAADGPPVPSLEIVPGLQPAPDGRGGSVGPSPSVRLRVGVIALVGAAVVAGAVFMLTRGLGHDRTGARVIVLRQVAAVPSAHMLPVSIAENSASVSGARLAIVDASPPPKPPPVKVTPAAPLESLNQSAA